MDRTAHINMGVMQANTSQKGSLGARWRWLAILFDVRAPELGDARIGLEDEHGTMLVSEYLGGFQSVGASA